MGTSSRAAENPALASPTDCDRCDVTNPVPGAAPEGATPLDRAKREIGPQIDRLAALTADNPA